MSFVIVNKADGEILNSEVIKTAVEAEKLANDYLIGVFRNEDKTELQVCELTVFKTLTQTVKATVKVK